MNAGIIWFLFLLPRIVSLLCCSLDEWATVLCQTWVAWVDPGFRAMAMAYPEQTQPRRGGAEHCIDGSRAGPAPAYPMGVSA